MFLFLLLQKRPLAFVLDLIEVIKKMLPSLVNFIVCRTQERCYLFIYFIIFGLMLIKRHALPFFLEGYSGVVEPSECIHISAMSKIVLKVNYLGSILVLTLAAGQLSFE